MSRKKRHLQSITNNDWIILSEYLKIMGPVSVALDRIQGEKNISQGYVLPILTSMRHLINLVEGNNIVNHFKRTMLDVIDKRFDRFFGINI